MTLTYASLCSGYGGLDLAVEAVFPGARQLWHAEFDPKPSQVHEAHWPGLPNLGDLTTAEFSGLDRPDLICAGYPCQPFSLAGKRKGTSDARHLWPHVARAVRDLRPRFVFLENVPGHRSLGFSEVLADLAEGGYDARWSLLRASEVGAPHRRERLFVLAANADERGHGWGQGAAATARQGRQGRVGRFAGAGEDAAADASHVGHERSGQARHGWDGPSYDGGAAADASGERPGQHARGTSRQEAGSAGGHVVADHRGSRPAVHWREAAADADGQGPQGWPGLRERAGEQPVGQAGVVPASDGFGWGATPYAAAIERWERITGRAAPHPRPDGRLSPAFVEWMMGLPGGWVTGHGLSRTAGLKMLGNGVVPQQAAYALRGLLCR